MQLLEYPDPSGCSRRVLAGSRSNLSEPITPDGRRYATAATAQLKARMCGYGALFTGVLRQSGGMQTAIDIMRAGNLDRAYCFIFGGYHTYPDSGHNYCVLHPLAAAVRYAQGCGFARVLIVDWDHHHGDGTQTIFASDPSVYCISIHSAADLYMARAVGLAQGMTSAAAAVGHGNIPLLNAAYSDEFGEQMGLAGRFYQAHESLSVVEETLNQLPWHPDLICIFSGYDAHIDDCGRDISNWTDDDFRRLTMLVLDLAHQLACQVFSVHNGGYNLPVTIAAAVSHVEVLAGYQGSS